MLLLLFFIIQWYKRGAAYDLRLKYHHFWHETAHTLAILFLFTWGVFHDSKRLRIYALLFFSNVRAFANLFAS